MTMTQECRNSFCLSGKVVLVTGAARRIGAVIAQHCHAAGATVAVHYRSSETEALRIVDSLNSGRPNSAAAYRADLLEDGEPERLIEEIAGHSGQLDVLVNNASTFYATTVGQIDRDSWDDLVGSNLRAPLFLSQAAVPLLRQTRGSIINLLDIHATTPAPRHTVYCIAKAGLSMMTRSLALELAPAVRVNGIAPGAILWPENGDDQETRSRILRQIPLARSGDPLDIAKLVVFLAADADYITGQVIAVDGGRSLIGL